MEIERIVETYGTYIYRYALKLTCNPHKAEDIAQETFISAWKHMEELRDENAIKKWLQKICFHQFLMDYRKEKANTVQISESIEELEREGKVFITAEVEPEESVMVEASIRAIQNGCFYAMVRKLSLNQRITFSLVEMFGLQIEDVAELLDLSTNATKALLHRARTNLGQFFSGYCNLLDAKNPCSCQSWIDFRTNHEKNIVAVQEIFHANQYYDEKKKVEESTKRKIHYLYTHMPEVQPEKEWFDRVLVSLK